MEIPHEVMHGLGLEHTFEEKEHPNKEHIFRKGSTENYMDYNNTKETTFKWQWRTRNLLTKRIFTEN